MRLCSLPEAVPVRELDSSRFDQAWADGAKLRAVVALLQDPKTATDLPDLRPGSVVSLPPAGNWLVPTIGGGGVVIQGWDEHPGSDADRADGAGAVCA
jgi:hypothetical protein